MPLKFTIIDYTTDTVGVETVIDEPVGWDGIGLRLKRDKTWHGFFDFFDDSYSQLQFIGMGQQILSNAYNVSGIEANCELIIEYSCEDNGNYGQVYKGKFNFTRYSHVCGDYCYVECGIENYSCLMTFRNRYDQKVDLDSLDYFDKNECEGQIDTVTTATIDFSGSTITIYGYQLNDDTENRWIKITGSSNNDGYYFVNTVTIIGLNTEIVVDSSLVTEIGAEARIQSFCLPKYSALGKEIVLPGKKLKTTSTVSNSTSLSKNFTLTIPASSTLELPLTIGVDFENIVYNENPSIVNTSTAVYGAEFPLSQFVKENLGTEILCTAISDDIEYRVKGSIRIRSAGAPIPCTFNFEEAIVALVKKVPSPISVEFLSFSVINGSESGINDITIDFDYTDTVSTTLNFSDELLLELRFSKFLATPDDEEQVGSGLIIELIYSEVNYLTVSSSSLCEPTKAKVYLVNEALSRISEIYTSNCLPVKSEYFGRKDSEPYANIEDGCGGLECITNGLIIRNNKQQDGKDPQLSISMKDMFESLTAIHNIGIGIEDNTVDGGKWVRIEPLKHFYDNAILIEFENIAELKVSINQDILFSTYKGGYAKWGTENINGLNDVFTGRTYRTSGKNIRNEYQKICGFIASDYAIEVTRRLYGLTTKDWRYDNDTFIICLTNKISALASFLVNAGDDSIIIEDSKYAANFSIGDTIIVQNSVSNNGTYTVTSVTFTVSQTIVKVAEPLVNEGFVYVVIDNITTPTLFVEQGNFISANNIVYPETTYNLRITPARNAMRHFKSLNNYFRNYSNGSLIFTNGEGNISAEIELINNDCNLENGLISENTNITTGLFTDIIEATPLYWPELITFEYPVTWEQYLTIKTNPYGLIGYSCGNGPVQYGWIEDFQLKPYTGMGQFTLRPKIAE